MYIFSKRPTLHISMQYFAEPDAAGQPDQSGADAGNDTDAGNAADKEPTLKELLASNKAYQSEFDKMSSKAQETAIANAKAKWEADAKAQADEAAKLAKMKADEKAEYERQRMNATDEEIQSIKELASAQQQVGVIGDEIQLAGAQ